MRVMGATPRMAGAGDNIAPSHTTIRSLRPWRRLAKFRALGLAHPSRPAPKRRHFDAPLVRSYASRAERGRASDPEKRLPMMSPASQVLLIAARHTAPRPGRGRPSPAPPNALYETKNSPI